MQKFTIQEVRDKEFSNIVERIYEVVGQNGISSKIDYRDLFFGEGHDNRDVFVSEENNTFNIYIGTKERCNNCILITARKNFLQISRATYRRMGNGTIQEGIIASNIYTSKKADDKYVQLRLYDSSEKQAQVEYFQTSGKVQSPNIDNFLVDPHTLEYVDEEGNKDLCVYFAVPEINQMLSLLKKNYIKGENEINGEIEIHEDEDLTSFGGVDINPGGKVITLNNPQK